MGRKIFFTNSYGHKLCGILSHKDTSEPIVIMAHGFAGSKDSDTFRDLETQLNKKNIATLRFDFYGHDESEGDFSKILVSGGVRDVLGAIDYVKSLGFSKIALMGSSFGGITSTIAASQSKDVTCLLLKSPVFYDLPEILCKMTRRTLEEWRTKGKLLFQRIGSYELCVNYGFVEDAYDNNGLDAAKLVDVPTLIIHGDADPVVPIEQSIKAHDVFNHCSLQIITGADHRYLDKKHYDEMVQSSYEFLIEQLSK